jgi:rubrerythrin
MPKMNLHRAQELIVPLRKGTANDISLAWQARLIEALEYVIEHESQPTKRALDLCFTCSICGEDCQDEGDGKCWNCGTPRTSQ